MGSVPKPAFLQIRGLDNEKTIARCSTEEAGLFVHSVDKMPVFVQVQWRQADQVPTLLSILSEIPKATQNHDLEVMRRDDGKYTLVSKGLRSLEERRGRGAGPTFYERARQGYISPLSDYLEYGNNLIKEYQPDFDYSKSAEEARLLLHTLERINRVRESVEDLQNYLWYSTPNKNKAVSPVKDPQRDVRAAVLQDLFDLSTLRIGEIMWFKAPSELDRARKHENAAVRAAAQRGRELLHYYFGVDEWRQKVERVRALRRQWRELEDLPKGQVYYLLAECHGTSIDEEEKSALQDGFDQLLEEWIAAWIRDDMQTANSIVHKDVRFEEFIRQI
jgi:hypothetical protein